MKALLNRTTGIIGTVLGLIVAIVGIYFWFFARAHHPVRGPVLLVVGILILAFGAWAYMTSIKAKAAI